MGYDGPELVRLGAAWFLYVRTPTGNTTQRYKLVARRTEASAK